MASALPAGMDEDRVAAMSAALLSLGERAAQGLGRGDLSQVYVEGDNGTVFLVSADDEAVLVAVGRLGAKVGLLLFEVKQAAAAVATCLRIETEDAAPPLVAVAPVPEPVPVAATPAPAPMPTPVPMPTAPAPMPSPPVEPVTQAAPQPVAQLADQGEPMSDDGDNRRLAPPWNDNRPSEPYSAATSESGSWT
jgi:predicted regulator of Ras-like GTPase activity (Roadblock/LC7/MglB family)